MLTAFRKEARSVNADPAEAEDIYEYKERSEQYNTQGVSFAKEGNLQQAIKYFRSVQPGRLSRDCS